LKLEQEEVRGAWSAGTGASPGREIEKVDRALVSPASSPDGTRAVAPTDNKTVRLFDLATGAAVGPPIQHNDMLNKIAFDMDGRRFVTASSRWVAYLWDGRTGARIGKEINHEGMVHDLAFSPDGKWLLIAYGDGKASLWDAGTGEAVGGPLPHRGMTNGVAWSPDSRRVATATNYGLAQVWDAGFVDDPTPPDLLLLRAQVRTGVRLDPRGEIEVIPPEAWFELKGKLDQREPGND
jgi:WD40 repeat protein